MIFNSTKFGYDISTWQDDPNIAGTVNFDKMRDSGASFVIFRASIGDQFDVDFPTYKVNSRGKLPRAVYHYYWNNIDPKIQAQKCLAAIGGETFEGRVWLDLETTTSGAFVGPTHWRTFLETIRAAGLRVGIYTGYYWWETNAVAKGADLAYFGQFPLWQAWYTSNPANVIVCKGFPYITNWQDTSSYPGAPAGVESPTIDHNQWNDAVDFAAEWGTVSPPPPTNGVTMYTGTAKTTATPNVRLRQATADGSPNPSGTTIGAIQPGQAFKGDLISGSWMRITEIGTKTVLALTGKPYGFSALQYLNYELVTVPPPVESPPATGDIQFNATLKADGTITGTWKEL